MSAPLPPLLVEVRDDLLALPVSERVLLLAEFAAELPAMPDEYAAHPERCERVQECQSPVFLVVEVDEHDVVTLHATAPVEAPTTRGLASILVQGLSGLSADEALAVPEDFPLSLGLDSAVSPLRLAGMAGMLRRAQRQVTAKRHP